MMNGLTNTTVCQNIESIQKYGAKQGESNGNEYRLHIVLAIDMLLCGIWWIYKAITKSQQKIRLFP